MEIDPIKQSGKKSVRDRDVPKKDSSLVHVPHPAKEKKLSTLSPKDDVEPLSSEEVARIAERIESVKETILTVVRPIVTSNSSDEEKVKQITMYCAEDFARQSIVLSYLTSLPLEVLYSLNCPQSNVEKQRKKKELKKRKRPNS